MRIALLDPVVAALLLASPLAAQERLQSNCIALSQGSVAPERVVPASFRDPVAQDVVRLTYIDHAMVLVQTPSVSAVTDYAGFIGTADFLPDVVTMNHAHRTHWTAFPDPAIPHVLRGWTETGEPASNYLDLGEMLVRSVATDIRGRMGTTEPNGNSIFVFEAGGLCIGHLGHLHHEPNGEDYARLGRMDVVMVPVDGGLTLDHETLIRTLDHLRARIIVPIHWFGPGNLEQFLGRLSSDYAIERRDGSEVTLTLADLPDRPTVIVLQPALLSDD